jgi:hypothetical protein
MSISCISMPSDPPWSHFLLSKYASSKQHTVKYTYHIVVHESEYSLPSVVLKMSDDFI